MVEKYLGGAVPAASGTPGLSVEEDLSVIPELFEKLEFNRIAEQLQKAIDKANRYIESSAPWKLAKTNAPSLPGIFHDLLKSIGSVSLYLNPFMPATSQKIWESIGQAGPVDKAAAEYFSGNALLFPVPGCKVNKPAILFPRIQDK
jgi:methionyl-tRNA synthetase